MLGEIVPMVNILNDRRTVCQEENIFDSINRRPGQRVSERSGRGNRNVDICINLSPKDTQKLSENIWEALLCIKYSRNQAFSMKHFTSCELKG